ncbi:hypothetical protein FRC20_008948 [Serendipita sp. 405]|nr:hypothetical protein FRC20_008948 [Serendipita sp. 405]
MNSCWSISFPGTIAISIPRRYRGGGGRSWDKQSEPNRRIQEAFTSGHFTHCIFKDNNPGLHYTTLKMSKATTKTAKPARPAGKGGKAAPKHKFIIDYSRPAADQIFDVAGFEKFLHDHIKVDGKEGNLGDKVKITKNDQRLTLTSQIPFSKRYLKYLTKKYLKKSTLRDFIRCVDFVKHFVISYHTFRVVASSKDTYELRFFNLSTADDEEE